MADVPDAPDPQDTTALIAKALIAAAQAPEFLNKTKDTGVDLIVESIKLAFFMLTTVAAKAVGPVVEGIMRGEAAAEGSYQQIAAATLAAMFDVEVHAGDINPFQQGGSTAAGQKIGKAVFRMFGDPQSTIEPSDVNANAYVARMVNLEVEGWLNGLIFEMLMEAGTGGWVKPEEFAKLKDGMVSALGLSRLSRRVLGPYVNAVCVQPFTWQVNKTYRPTLLSPAQAARQVLRGRKTNERFFEETARAGYDDGDAESILNSAKQKLSVADWLYLERFAGVTSAAVDAALRDSGVADEEITWLRLLERTKRSRGYLEATAAAVIEAYLEGHADAADVNEVFSVTYQDPDERALIWNRIQAQRAAKSKRMSKGDIENAVTRRILSIVDYRAWLKAEGYDAESANALELMLSSEIRGQEAADAERRRVAAEKKAAADAKAADDARRRLELEARKAAEIPPLGDIKAAVIRGLLSIDRYTASLQARGYRPDDVAFLTSMLVADRDRRLHADEVRAAADASAGAAHLSLGQLERAVLAGLVDLTEYDRQLDAAGYDDADRAVLVALLQTKLDEQTRAARVATDAAAVLAKKGVSLPQAERATRIGVWTPARFREWLTSQQLDDVAVATIAATMDADLAADDVARAKRDVVARELDVKGISLPQLEAAVLRGLAPLDTYRQTLLKAGYGADDVALLVELLQSKVDDAAQTKTAHDIAVAGAADRRVTLPQIERAVVLGSVTLDAYDAYLADLGYDDEGRAILHANLVAMIQAARAVDARRASLEDAGAVDAAALAVLEADVVAGDAPISDYRVALAARALAAADVDALVERLQAQLDDQSDAAQLAGVVDAELTTAKDLTLGQWHDAVKAGLRSLWDYRAFLASRYAPADVDILVALLDQQLAREATKAK